MIDFGITPDEFRASWLEREPRLVKGALRGEPFAWSELDQVLHGIEPAPPFFQLFNDGQVPPERYTERVAERGSPRLTLDKRRFYGELGAGATLVINRFESHSTRATRLCAEVARFASARTIGNAYLSVGGRGTFGKHWDTHDVFAIQLLGRKRWQVFAPTFPLPLGVHTSRDSGHACPAAPALDCVLEAGDLLYVPRGFWHQAIPFAEPSLHFSIGAYAPTVQDYVLWACARHLPAVLGARRSLTEGVSARDLGEVLESLGDILLADGRRAEYERELAGAERVAPEFQTELFLAAGPDGLRDGAVLRLNAGHHWDAAAQEIVVNGAWLRLHALPRAIVAALAEAALPIEDLCARLPREQPAAIRSAVLELALHEIVAIERRESRAAEVARRDAP